MYIDAFFIFIKYINTHDEDEEDEDEEDEDDELKQKMILINLFNFNYILERFTSQSKDFFLSFIAVHFWYCS